MNYLSDICCNVHNEAGEQVRPTACLTRHWFSQDHPSIGHVRGLGLFVGIEMVIPGTTKPAPGTAKFVKESMKKRRLLVSTDGHHNHVIKIKPPMCFDKSNADSVVAYLADLLQSGLPAEVKAKDQAYDPSQKSTRVQNTTWQSMPVNGTKHS